MLKLFKPLILVLVNGGLLYVLTRLVKGIVFTGGIKFFIIGGLVLGLINLILKPLMKVLSLPLIFLTGGIFLVVVNMAVLWFLQYFISVIKFEDVTLIFPNLVTYAIGAVVFGIMNFAVDLIV